MAVNIMSNTKSSEHHKDIARAIQKLDVEAHDEGRHPGGMEIACLVLRYYGTQKANTSTVTMNTLLSITVNPDPKDTHFKDFQNTWDKAYRIAESLQGEGNRELQR